MKNYRYEPIEHDACGIGAIANIDGHPDHRVLDDALHIVEKLEHRAGKDASGKVGDGVGILTQIPHELMKEEAKKIGISLGAEREYGVGMFFLPQNDLKRTLSKRMFEVIVAKNNLRFLGWRSVPVHSEILGKLAKDCMPSIEQCFIAKPDSCENGLAFDRLLYVARREFEQGSDEETYITSLSSRTIVYKGMFLVNQLREFYDDLKNKEYQTAIAVIHSRFSTNTSPSWNRAHPYRMIAHNGEINTIRGNIDRMLAREETMHAKSLQNDIDKIFPVVNATGSDSAMVDNTLEFLYMSGMDLPLALMVMIPEPWHHNPDMDFERKNFYHYYATMMEPWDGPAAILFTDGDLIGATLDRNGLRPVRYYVTKDGRMILSSEVGVLDNLSPEDIVQRSKLEPGRILLVNTKEKRIVSDQECKQTYAQQHPYGEWLNQHLLNLEDLTIPNKKLPEYTQVERDRLYKVFGYSYEEVKDILLPMAQNGVEPTGSMGHDTPLAVLSQKHLSLFDYFKQHFAQVTNPPIDSIREEVVTDTTVYIGSDGNLLEAKGDNCSVLEAENPILTGVDLMKIKKLDKSGFRTEVIPMLYYKNTSLEKAVDQLMIRCDRAYENGSNILILTDRGVDENHVPIPSLLAVSAVEQHLVNTRKRTKISLILESGELRTVHQCAAVLGFGARAICPYLAQECISEMISIGMLDKDYHTAVADYNQALLKGIVKTAAKMGISTIQSYQSARIFEALGLSKEFIDRYFTGTVSRVGGIGIEEIEADTAWRHDHAFDPMGLGLDTSLDSVGMHKLRSGKDGEAHLYRPEVMLALQKAARSGKQEDYQAYADMVEHQQPMLLRSLMEFHSPNKSIPLEDVEPVSEIVQHFKTGAMSYGSISQEAHECMAIAMNRLKGKSNTGEGGENPNRFHTERNSAIKQVASGRFGVNIEYLNSATEIQIKMAQGAKPGEGGFLPGKKVYPWVAKTRCSTPGVSLISPPPHHDIYSIEDLAQLIYDLKNANPKARINVKLVSENGVGTIACGVAKAGAQVILISGYDGGTGAAPYSSIHNTGLPWELGLAEAHHALIDNGLRTRVILETDGKLMTGRDVAIAALLGAEEFSFGTAAVVSMGCMMMRVCSLDTCPFGIATQSETLRKRFKGKPEYVMNFMQETAQELREIMAGLGFHTLSEMTGRTDCLRQKKTDFPVDLSKILDTKYAHAEKRHFEEKDVYDFHLENTIDEKVLIPEALKATPEKGKQWNIAVSSSDRTVGTLLGSALTQKYHNTLKDDTYVIHCTGGAGQSFGSFLPKGITLKLQGDANDYVARGLSGGKIIVSPESRTNLPEDENVIIGNVALYGATCGTAYFAGRAGERFCVRNSGAIAVAEGCGDHGLEYMTGGKAVILGRTGKNFAAGMSGGIAYVLDINHDLYRRLNPTMVIMKEVTEKFEIQELKEILKDFVKETGSVKGKEILDNFHDYLPHFKKIVPEDYQKMLGLIGRFEESGMPKEKAEMEAFRVSTEGR